METTETINTKPENPFPFNNLFLIKGFITGKNEFWKYILGIFAAFLGYLSFQLILIIPLMNAAMNRGISMIEITNDPNILFNPDKIGIDKSLLLALMMGMFVFTFLFFWMAIKIIQKKTLTSIISGFDTIRWNRYFFSFVIWGVLIIILTLISYAISPEDIEIRFNTNKFLILLFVSVLLIPIQTATEELIFRGYLLQGFSLIFKNGISALIITSVLFGLMHASNPEAKAHGLLIMMPYYIFFGAFLGVLTLLNEGSELAMGIHCANNLFSSLLVCSKNSVLQTDAIFYTSSENPSGEFLTWIIMASICFVILLNKYKLTNFKLLFR